MSNQPELLKFTRVVFTRVVFGINSSSFRSQFVLQKHAEKYKKNLLAQKALAEETVDKSTHLDESMDSVKTEGKAAKLYNQLTQLWEKARMTARKWISNSNKVLEYIPLKSRAAKINIKNRKLTYG